MRFDPRSLRHFPSKTVAVPVTSASVGVITTGCLLTGYSFIESTGTASASFDLHDGSGGIGELFDPIALSAGQSRSDDLPEDGIWMFRGVWVQMVTGSIRGAIWIKTFDYEWG